ncbi:hypothetical protein OAH05_01745, partial [bacterium]|nr:hypothetical protein [bacterium]
RVYTGAQALDLGLVDELGTLDDAITYLVEDLQLEDYEIRTEPEGKNILEMLIQDLSPQQDEGNNRRLSLGLWSAIEPSLQHIDPVRIRMVQQALMQLDFLTTERVMLTTPVMLIR